MSKSTLDLSGLACPEPLMAFVNEAKKTGVTEIALTADCGAARENISRAAASMGWSITVHNDDGEHVAMTLTKGA